MNKFSIQKARKLSRVLAESDYRKALRHKVAAATEHEDVVFGREYGIVIDVGANRGQFALFARHRFPQANIVCFEPLPLARHTLSQLFRDDSGVRIESCALSSAPGSTDLTVTRSDDSSSLLRPTALQVSTFPDTEAVSVVTVDVKRLDDIADIQMDDAPLLLKIDVQGFELEVLRGSKMVLEGDCDVLVESSFAELYGGQALADEIICLMFNRGYRLRGIYSVTHGRDGAPLQGDLFFTRETAPPTTHRRDIQDQHLLDYG